MTFIAPPPFKPAQVESYTLTCEVGGNVLETQQVTVARGQRLPVSLAQCTKAVQGAAAAAPAPKPASATAPTMCVAGAGFKSASARGASRRVSFAFARRVSRPVTVDVFQQSVGRRVIGERLVARYANRSRGFTWSGRANRQGRTVTDGYYFVRYRIAQPRGGSDVRRVTLRRAGGRWSQRSSFYRPDSCGTVRSFKLTRPVFGGRANTSLEASFRLAQSSRVGLEVLRGTTVVKRFAPATRRAGVTHRLRLASERLRRGDCAFRLTVRTGTGTVVYRLTSRRL